jgi:uncharacterized repeat protein (TIGR03803 family)
VLHSFTGGGDGYQPYASLTLDRGGNLYGTTAEYGGIFPNVGTGTVFQMKHSNGGWRLSTLYTFSLSGNPGYGPVGGIVFGPDGALYGTTSVGGPTCGGVGCGAVYRLTPQASLCHSVSCPWRISTLHNFQGGEVGDGQFPQDNLVFDAAGNLYGTTPAGGQGNNARGTVFQMSRSGDSWTENILNTFSSGGSQPRSGVTLDSAGNLYGTLTYYYGSVFKLSHSASGWTPTTLYGFQPGSDGHGPINPAGGLIMDSAGNLYGTTAFGGTADGGIVFELSPSGDGWTYSTLYNLPGNSDGPFGALAMDTAGNLYGTTQGDGAYGYGSVFKLTHDGGSWIYSDLHDFTGGDDGAYPQSGVTVTSSGTIYGTVPYGGIQASNCNGPGHASGCGVVYQITQ